MRINEIFRAKPDYKSPLINKYYSEEASVIDACDVSHLLSECLRALLASRKDKYEAVKKLFTPF